MYPNGNSKQKYWLTDLVQTISEFISCDRCFATPRKCTHSTYATNQLYYYCFRLKAYNVYVFIRSVRDSFRLDKHESNSSPYIFQTRAINLKTNIFLNANFRLNKLRFCPVLFSGFGFGLCTVQRFQSGFFSPPSVYILHTDMFLKVTVNLLFKDIFHSQSFRNCTYTPNSRQSISLNHYHFYHVLIMNVIGTDLRTNIFYNGWFFFHLQF